MECSVYSGRVGDKCFMIVANFSITKIFEFFLARFRDAAEKTMTVATYKPLGEIHIFLAK